MSNLRRGTPCFFAILFYDYTTKVTFDPPVAAQLLVLLSGLRFLHIAIEPPRASYNRTTDLWFGL